MRPRLSLAGLLTLAILLAPAAAQGATLVGGRRQSAIATSFFAHRAHRGLTIVSERISTVAPSWAVVKAVRPERSGRSTPTGGPPRLQSAYYHLTARGVRPGTPPSAARTDLSRDFRVAVTYTGSGTESIQYDQLYRSVCPGAGGFTDEQSDTVTPMSWSVRYVVDLDALQSAVHSSAGTVLVAAVSFARSQSTLAAREVLSRTAIDEGCNGLPTTFACNTAYALAPPSDGLLSFPATGGLEIGVPTTPVPTGECDPSDYTLGPSLWAGGATTAVAPGLGLIGGALPANPYRSVAVSWPRAAPSSGAPASPCQGDGAACRDTFHWSGHVSLKPVP